MWKALLQLLRLLPRNYFELITQSSEKRATKNRKEAGQQ
jgi:hypothetical protein